MDQLAAGIGEPPTKLDGVERRPVEVDRGGAVANDEPRCDCVHMLRDGVD